MARRPPGHLKVLERTPNLFFRENFGRKCSPKQIHMPNINTWALFSMCLGEGAADKQKGSSWTLEGARADPIYTKYGTFRSEMLARKNSYAKRRHVGPFLHAFRRRGRRQQKRGHLGHLKVPERTLYLHFVRNVRDKTIICQT